MSGGGTVLSEYSNILYDGAGNTTSVNVSVPAAPSSYSGLREFDYDNKDQLLSESGTRDNNYSASSVYDGGAAVGAGNATGFKGASQSFNADNQNASFGLDGSENPTTFNSGLP